MGKRVFGWTFLIGIVLLSLILASSITVAACLISFLVFCAPALCLYGKSLFHSASVFAKGSILGLTTTLLFIPLVSRVIGFTILAGLISASLATLLLKKIPYTESKSLSDESWTLPCIFALAVLFIISGPLLNVGRQLNDHYVYHSYFNQDSLKHWAYTHSLAKGDFPPEDPYCAGQALRYYWLAYGPAAIAVSIGRGMVSAVEAVQLIGLWQTILLCFLMFSLVKSFAQKKGWTLALCLFGALTLSFDGIVSLLARANMPNYAQIAPDILWCDLTQLFGAPNVPMAVQSFFALCLHVQQHQLAIAQFLCFLIYFYDNNRLSYLLIIPSLAISFPIGFLSICSFVLLVWFSQKTLSERMVTVFIVCSLSLLIAVSAGSIDPNLWGTASTESALHRCEQPNLFSSENNSSAQLLWLFPQFFTAFGPIFLLAIFGIALAENRKKIAIPIFIGVSAILAGNAFLPPFFAAELEMKASFFLIPLLTIASANVVNKFEILKPSLRLLIVLVSLTGLFGLPSFYLEHQWRNSIAGSRCLKIPLSSKKLLDWMRVKLSDDAVILEYPYPIFPNGSTDSWIPPFAGRSVPAACRGMRVSATKMSAVHAIFELDDGDSIYEACKKLKVDYVLLDLRLGEKRFARLVGLLKKSTTKFSLAKSMSNTYLFALH